VERKLDLERWPRRPHFELFRHYADPFFNITAEVDVTQLCRYVDDFERSFFAASYFLVLKIANEIEEFRLRIRGDEVVIHDRVHGSCTVLNRDATFSFCFFECRRDFGDFELECARILERNEVEPSFNPRFDRDDLVHSSIIPWVRFSAFEHAKRLGAEDSCPKIVLGRYGTSSDRSLMPISVAGHHAVMDGIHAGMFFEKYETYAGDPERYLERI
jgi:chloramphenicol O-acetyltransferase type A